MTTLSPAIEQRLRVLASPQMTQWEESGFGLPARRREAKRREQHERIAREVGLATVPMPLEQLDLLRRFPASPSQAIESLGLVGEAVDFLSQRYFGYASGYPTPRHQRLGEFQHVKRRMVVEQLACWKAAVAMRQGGLLRSAGPTSLPRLDWPSGLPIEHHHLAGLLAEQLVEGHVHLGGVLGTLDLWPEVLDPRLRPRRLRVLKESIHRLEEDPLPAYVLRRLESARMIRDLLALELARIGAMDLGTTASLYRTAVDAFRDDVVLEQALVPAADGILVHFSIALASHETIPLTLSPWWRQHRAASTIDEALVLERAFLVRSFAAVLGVFPARPGPWFGPLLSVYLVCQNLFHRAVTQQGERVGLANFLPWYDTPRRWVRASSHPARQQQILDRVSHNWRHRVEGRVIPGSEAIRPWLRGFRRRRAGREAQLGRDFGLVIHFIKEPDPRAKRRAEEWERAERGVIVDPPDLLRHAQLRRKVRYQCYELERLRAVDPEAACAVVGIDAASAEEDTPPEVFAPTFRFLRRGLPNVRSGSALGRTLEWVPPLRATFHVGESFHHPLTGLRRVAEAVRFLALGPGDRLGHGMVLGIDPERWLEHCGPPPCMTREEYVDNLVWVAEMLRERQLDRQPLAKIEDLVAREFEPLYGCQPVPPPRSLTSLLGWAWKLRWMDPVELFAVLERIGWENGWPSRTGASAQEDRRQLGGNLHSCLGARRCLVRRAAAPAEKGLCHACRTRNWSRCPPVLDPTLSPLRLAWRLSTLDPEQLFSGEIPIASLRYLWCYYFDRSYYRRGHEPLEQADDFPDWVRLFEPLREAVLAEVSRRDLTIEACPSSNQLVGGFADLTDHPVFRLDTHGLKKGCERPVRVTVNTDNPGIFATNLPNEYALLARAAEDRGEDPANVQRWIAHLRQRGVESTFLRPEGREAYDVEDESWPPNLALYPHWKDRPWRRFALAAEQRRETERLVGRLRRLLLDLPV